MSWKSYKLGDILERKRNKVNISPDKKYKLVTIKLHHKGVVLRHKKKGVDIKSNMYLVNEEDFILSGIDARNGAFGIVPKELENAIVTNDFWCLEPKKDILRKDFFFFITSTSFFDYICNQCSDGTTQRIRLQREKFYNYELRLPPIEKQEELVKRLNENNETNRKLSTELTHQLSLVKQLRQSFLREAMQGCFDFAQQADANEETGAELLAKIKAEKELLIKEKKLKRGKASSQSVSLIDKISIPNNWTWAKTDDIFFVTKLAGFEYSKYITLKGTGEIPVIRAQNVRPFEIKKSNLLYIERKTSELLYRCALTKEALLVTFIGAGIGDVARFYEKERWHLAPNVAKLEPFEGCESLMNLKFLNYFLMSENGRAEIFKHVKATAQPSLSMGTIRDIDLLFPPLSEQKLIVEKLNKLMSYCDSLEESIKNSQKQNEMLLAQVLREALEPDSTAILADKPKETALETN